MRGRRPGTDLVNRHWAPGRESGVWIRVTGTTDNHYRHDYIGWFPATSATPLARNG